MLPQNFFIFILFYDFYRKTYNKKPQVTESGVKADLNNNLEVNDKRKFSNHSNTAKPSVLSYDKSLSD